MSAGNHAFLHTPGADNIAAAMGGWTVSDEPGGAPDLQPDFDQARRHLQALDPGADSFIFQTFDDSKNRKDAGLIRVLHGSFEQHRPELVRLNRQGAGIFVTVNRTLGASRKKADVCGYRAIFREADEPNLPNLPLAPHLMIETSPCKRHEYVLLADCQDGDTWDSIMAGMVADWGSDPNARDRSRVLRLAGFYHQKDPAMPHMVKIIHESGHDRYSLGDVARFIRPVSKQPERCERPQPCPSPGARGYAQAALAHELSSLAGAPEGSRNAALNESAFSLGQLVGGGSLEESVVESALRGVAGSIGLQSQEIEKTLRSGLEAGKLKPRGVPERERSQTHTADLASREGGSALDSQTEKDRFMLVPAHEVIKNVKTIEWLIWGMIERHSFAELFGDSGTYKSFVALDMALSVATGKPFHGRPVIQGPVVIVIGEGLHGYGRRLAAWANHHGIDLADYPVFVSNMAAQFLDDESAAEVERSIHGVEETHGKVELVLIDTLNRNFGPGDENSAKDMTQFIAGLDRRIGNDITRLVIHHTGHSNKERARGSYVLPAALDCEIQVSRKEGVITLSNTKQKEAPEFAPLKFETISINLDADETIDLLNPVTSLVLQEIGVVGLKKLTPAQQKVYDIVVSKVGTKCSKKDIFESLHLSQSSLSSSNQPEAERKAMQRAIKELISNRYIKEIGDECYENILWDNWDMSGTN